jgi:hypothetical protein
MSDPREFICGTMGDITWKSILPPAGLEGLEAQGAWTRRGDTLIGKEQQGAATLAFGDEGWTNYELAAQVKAIAGGNIQLVFRATADGNYVLDFLMGWKAVAVSKADRRPGGRGFHKASVVNFPLEHHKEYDVQIAVRDASITSYIDGQLVNQLTDYDFPKGRAGLSVWQGETEFRNPRYRLLQ